jgi:hypothetical protein
VSKQIVDLSSHINRSVIHGEANFPVVLRPVLCSPRDGDQAQPVPERRAIVREDTGAVLAVVSDRYTLVPHAHILDAVGSAIQSLDVGPVPRGIYVDRQGAQLRAVFKFPALAQAISGTDEICPFLKVQNTYDGSSRVIVQLGAFRFVCTNMAVGGGGTFAGGFMAMHVGEVDVQRVMRELASYLKRFEQIVTLYRAWQDHRPEAGSLDWIFRRELQERPKRLGERWREQEPLTVYDAYNIATYYATHEMRSARTAFELLERINSGFQKSFPVRS